MSHWALRGCPHCGSHLTEIDPEGDLYCIACTRVTLDPARLAWLAAPPARRQRRAYTVMLAPAERERLLRAAAAEGCSGAELVWLLLADAGPLPPDEHGARVTAPVTVPLWDAQLMRLAELGGAEAPVSSLLRRLIRSGLPRVERGCSLMPGGRIAS